MALHDYCAQVFSSTSNRHRRRRRPPSVAVSAVASLLSLASLAVHPAFAVQIEFENCLPQSYILSTPSPLQWVPLYVDAVFQTSFADTRNLAVTVWGNVTGSQSSSPLPPSNSTSWLNPAFTDGKILRNPAPERLKPLATTLITNVHLLTYEPWHAAADLCETSLVNASCPLGPVFHVSNISLPYGLPSVNLSRDFFSSYAFTSFSAVFIIIYGDEKSTTISCVSATITPDLGGLSAFLRFLPAAILAFVGLATAYAAILSTYGTSDVFNWTSNYGRHPDLLRLVTPGFADCLHYLQFIVLTGGLSLNYPGFYQPAVSQAAWSALMFNNSLVSHLPAWSAVQDGVYVANASYGLGRLGQLVGMPAPDDIWAGSMVWLVSLTAGLILLVQAGFVFRWLYRFVRKTPEVDLRSKNLPFIGGNVIRLVLVYFSLPLISLSTFQLTVASQSPTSVVALAVIMLLLMLVLAGRVLYVIATTRPRVNLFDDLQTLLLYGPLYNTYSDQAAPYAIVPLLLALFRGVAIGALQASGVAQLTMLAICEVIQILTLHAFRPFQAPTWMNAYHTIFASARFVAVLLMTAFAPSLSVDEGSRGWVGYAVLVLHGSILVFAFFLNALQKIVEVSANMLDVGTRGPFCGGSGLSRIFGARQLSRRLSRHTDNGAPSRQSQRSSTAMIYGDGAAKRSDISPTSGAAVSRDDHDGSASGIRFRSESAGSLSGLLVNDGNSNSNRGSGNSENVSSRRQTASASETVSTSLDAQSPLTSTPRHQQHSSGATTESGTSSVTPGTNRDVSPFSFLSSTQHLTPLDQAQAIQGQQQSKATTYYRPPRQRRVEPVSNSNLTVPSGPDRNLRHSLVSLKRYSQAIMGGGAASDLTELDGGVHGGVPGQLSRLGGGSRTDYSTREVDLYYGVRGPALSSDGPGRKLGTGPADPTGPIASASSWLRGLVGSGGRKEKDKVKGFEVLRGARASPPVFRSAIAIAPYLDPDSTHVGCTDLEQSEGIPVALGVLVHGSSRDADDTASFVDPDAPGPKPLSMPEIPRKSSRRLSAAMGPTLDPPLLVLSTDHSLS